MANRFSIYINSTRFVWPINMINVEVVHQTNSVTMTGPAQEVISRLNYTKCHKLKEKQMKDYHSCQFKVGLSDLFLHQS